MESTGCYNGYELIGNELGMTADELIRRIQSNPKETSDLIKSQALYKIPFVLGNDLTLKGSEAAFIPKGSDLWEHLENFFQRIHREAEFLSSPLIRPSDEVNQYLQEKIGRQLHAISNKLFASERMERIYESFEKLNDMRKIAQEFSNLASKYLSNQQLIAGFISTLATNNGKNLVTQSTEAAFVSMAVMRHYSGPELTEAQVTHQRIVDMGMALLFQDVAHIIDNSEHDPGLLAHTEDSAQIAKEMGLSVQGQETIRNHHRVVDADGRAILANHCPPLEERIAVLTNAFIQCVSKEHFNLDSDQAIYILEHYANRQFYDKHCVQTLGTLGIGDRKYKILSQSYQFVRHCKKGATPYIWNISMDFPNRFICRHSECEHLSDEEVVVYNTIRFKGTLQDLTIPKGRYYKCEKITRMFNIWLLETFFSDQAARN
jgi:hypothetical protein